MTKKTPDLFESEQNEVETNVESSASQPESTLTFTAGQTLANARTAAGIALDDLAEELRIPLKVLEGIEQDDWPENLPETFVRGYIRAYAKRVNVPEGDVLSAIDSTAASQPSTTEMHSFSKRSKRKKIEKRLVLVTWILGLALILAFAIWFVQSYSANQVAPVAETNSTDSLILPVPASATMDEIEVPLETTDSEAKDEQSDDLATPEIQPQNSESGDNQGSNETNAPVSTQVNTQPVDAVSTAEQKQLDESQASMQLSDEQLKLVAQGGDSDDENYMVVEFRFENDCWVEVYDAYNERIAIGNKPAGYLMTLNAQGPFNVLLGNPVGVSIWVNGEPYDISDMPTNRVARFEIDEQP